MTAHLLDDCLEVTQALVDDTRLLLLPALCPRALDVLAASQVNQMQLAVVPAMQHSRLAEISQGRTPLTVGAPLTESWLADWLPVARTSKGM